MTQQGGIRSVRLWYLLVLAICAIALVSHAVAFFAAAPACIRYPYEINYTEGSVLCQIRDLISGAPLYGKVGERPYTFTIYPPLYHVLTAALATQVGDTLVAGRSLSFACSIWLALVIAGVIYRVGAEAPGPLRCAGAAIGSLSFLSIEHVFAAAIMMRVDMLALSLATTGLFVFLLSSGASGRIVALLFFTLAVVTKHSAIAAPAACILGTAIVSPRAGFKLGLAFVALVGLAFAALGLIFGEAVYFHVFSANALSYNPFRAAGTGMQFVREYRALVASGFVGFLCLLSATLWGSHARRSDARSWTLAAYFVVSWASVLATGRAGTSANHLIDVSIALCTFTGLAVVETGTHLWTRTSRTSPLARTALAIAVPLALIWQAARQAPPHRSSMPDYRQRSLEENETLLNQIRAAPGPVFGVTQFLVCRAGKPAQINTFMAAQLAMLGRWDERPLLDDVRRKEFALVFLEFDLMGKPYSGERFTPELIAALRENYRFDERIGAYHLYRPAR